jgi:hypothetical protein
MLPHELNKNRKLLLKVAEFGLSNLVNWMTWFFQFRQHSGAPLALDKGASPPTKRPLDER